MPGTSGQSLSAPFLKRVKRKMGKLEMNLMVALGGALLV